MGKKFLKKVFNAPFKVVREVAKPITKILPKPLQKALPLLGSIGGGIFGGPGGAILGGALGGAAGGGRHPLDHALGGAALGFGHGILSPMLGQALSLNPDSFLAKATMMNSPSLLGSIGVPGFSEAAAANQLSSNMAAAGAGRTLGGGGGGIFGSLLGGGNNGLLNAALLATSLGGALKAKRKREPRETETLQEAINRAKRPSEDHFREIPARSKAQFPPREYRGLDWNYFPTAEEQIEQLRRANEEIANATRYARGGLVKGYYKGKKGGQSDKNLVGIPKKSFVVDSTTVSLAGDGNSENGAEVLRDWVDSFQGNHFVKVEPHEHVIRAYVSDGEFKIMPEEVAAIGSGSIKKGAKIINDMRKGIRKHKGVKKFLPPKSKSLDNYAGIRR